MNRLFDEAFRSFDDAFAVRAPAHAGRAWRSRRPTKELRVSAELPGLEEKDVEVLLADDVLTIRGEKKSEVEDKERQFSERFYGRFERRIPLGIEVEEDKVAASFKNGVLTVTLPKSARARARAKRIAINGRE